MGRGGEGNLRKKSSLFRVCEPAFESPCLRIVGAIG